jgi:ATP-grasp ribosomal peptide maturase
VTVLVLAEEHDPTVDRIVTELARRDVPVFRCNLGWFPQRMSLGAQLRAGRWCGLLRTEHRDVELVDIHSVLYRRPTSFTFPESLSGPERRHATWEAKLGVGGILGGIDALWVNHPTATADCAYKPVQLATAERCGFAVPPTLITSVSDDVHAFAAEHGQIVVKTLAFGAIFEDGGGKILYTHALTADDLADLAGVETTTHLFQKFINDKAFEARVTVVGGDRMFAAAIHAGSDDARVDFRADYGALSYRVIEVPQQVAEQIRMFMKELRINYGAFDFVVDHDQRWWWLEVNSGGQYGWIEGATGLPITAAMADLLEKGQL